MDGALHGRDSLFMAAAEQRQLASGKMDLRDSGIDLSGLTGKLCGLVQRELRRRAGGDEEDSTRPTDPS